LRILSKADVKQLMDMQTCIRVNRAAFVAVAEGRARVPVKHHVPVENPPNSVSLFMPGYLPDVPALGLKVVSVFPQNPAQGLPTILGAIMLISPATGEPLALMDGTWLTSLRTGAATGVSAQVLAREDAETLTLLGAGGMAFHQVEAVLAVRPIRTVYLWNRTPDRAESLAVQVRELGERLGRDLSVTATSDSESAVRRADVVAVGTSSPTPVLLGRWVRPGTHVSLIGSHEAHMREADDELLLKSRVKTVDALDSAMASGDVRLPVEAGVVKPEELVTLGAVAAGRVPGRQHPEDITWFKSVGLAAQDLACAAEVLRLAEERGLGTVVEL
jgi:ornithine cyclodeaminase/alanine dehydrogenase-like protein (mu-crystallin family)